MSDFVLGLTGGIASGKSTVEACFRALGISVVDADTAAREAVAVGSTGLAEVVQVFGSQVLASDGQLDRHAMRARVFADPAARKQLEAIVHPRVRAALAAACRKATSPYAIASIPLVVEGGGRDTYPWLQRILVIDVPAEVQLTRLLQRDGRDTTLAKRMIAAQTTRQQRLAIADDVLVNTSPVAMLGSQIGALDRLYRRLAATAGNAQPDASSNNASTTGISAGGIA